MSKVKLRTENANLIGKKINLPLAGETQIDDEGCIEVSDAVAALILKQHNGTFVSLDGEEDEETEEKKEAPKKATKKKEAKEDEEAEEEQEDASEEDEDGLDELELPELIGLAKEAGIKEPTYRKFKKSKKLMIKFLRENA